MRHLMCALLIAALSVWVADAQAKVLCVNASTGSDATTYAAITDPGACWATVGRAAWGSTTRSSPNTAQAAQAGDEVRVYAGTYSGPGTGARYEVSFNPANNGTAGSLIVFRAVPRGGVTLTLSSSSGPVIGCHGRSYIVWDGFYIDEANAPPASDTGPVSVQGGGGCQILNNELNGIYASYSDNHEAISVRGADNTVIRGNTAYEFGEAGPKRGQNNCGVVLYNAENTLIEHNYFYDNGCGIFVKGQELAGQTQQSQIIRFNRFHRNRIGITVGAASLTDRIYQNIFTDCIGVDGGSPTTDEAVGLRYYAADDGQDQGERPENTIVANNTIYNCDLGVIFGPLGVTNTHQNNLISTVRFALYNPVSSANCGLNGFTVWNRNLYHSTSQGLAWFPDWTNKANLAAWQSACPGFDANASSSNPNFVNAGAGDFHLQAGSPALSLGVDVLDLDNDGSTSDTVPVGAYVTGTEIIGLCPDPDDCGSTGPGPGPGPSPGGAPRLRLRIGLLDTTLPLVGALGVITLRRRQRIH